jgi:hypothetical protein
MTLLRHVLFGSSLLVLAGGPAGAQQTVSNEFFEARIRPVLAAKCYNCHSSTAKELKGYLMLDTRAGVMKGGTLGPAIVPGNPGDSKLIHAIKYADPHLQMPPSGKLADEIIRDFETWIAGGAPDPRIDTAGSAATATKRRVVDEAELAKGRRWWAFQPVKVLPQPVSSHGAAARRKLDHFVLAKLAEKGLRPSPQADDRTIVRRVYIDLIGLKPTYDEVEAYANDRSPDKYEKLVEKLLAMPQYGERWARYWLDVVRYGEDNPGGATSPAYPHAWRYRDWVIESLNKDVPYDRFVKMQLGADLMPGTSRSDLRALGPVALGPQDHKDVRLSLDVVGTAQLNDWDERLDTVTRGLMGVSVACARCHDHKFDPIRQMDYAKLLSVFASTARALRPYFEIDPKTETRFMWVYQRMFDLHYTANLLESDPGSKPEQAARQVGKYRQELSELQAEIDEMSKQYPEMAAYIKTVPYPGEKRPDQRNPDGTLKKEEKTPDEKRVRPADVIPNPERVQKKDGDGRPRKRIDPLAPFLDSVYDAGIWWNLEEPDLTFLDATPGKPRDLPLYRGGNLGTPTDPARRGFPLVLAKGDTDFKNGSGRLELGEKIFSDAAPLSARVIVNRVWGWHFGTHLVGTPSDFGIQGQKPSHPELLEDLSARFIENGWSLKWLHREIMLSATYRQSSQPRSDAMEADPTNTYVWRMNPHRLDIEAYRDSILQASGKLDLTLYGPSADVEKSTRRTVYANISRGPSTPNILKLFDAPPPMLHIPMRQPTLNPLQALFVMNSAFVQEQAKVLAGQVENEAAAEAKVQQLYLRVFSRNATADEVSLGVEYLGKADTARYAQALLSTNEVIFWP